MTLGRWQHPARSVHVLFCIQLTRCNVQPYLDDLETHQHASLGIQSLHSFAESCRTQEVHHLQQQRLITPRSHWRDKLSTQHTMLYILLILRLWNKASHQWHAAPCITNGAALIVKVSASSAACTSTAMSCQSSLVNSVSGQQSLLDIPALRP